jgi:hypothetical protein
LSLLAGNFSNRTVLLVHFQRWYTFWYDAREEFRAKMKLVVRRMTMYHAAMGLRKWTEAGHPKP